jgi:hypothetical protein
MEISRRSDGKLKLILDEKETSLIDESLRGFLEDQSGALPAKAEGTDMATQMLADIKAAR